eukprot:gene5809-6049_t
MSGNGLGMATYNQGATIQLQVVLTANHGGKFFFRICPRSTGLDEACFGTNYLTRVDNGQVDTWLLSSQMTWTLTYQLPAAVSCDAGCVLQWKYFAMQSCIEPGCNPAYCGVYASGINAVYGGNPGFCSATSAQPEYFNNCAGGCGSVPVLGVQHHLMFGQAVVYFESWSSQSANTGADLDIARIPGYINVVIVSFAKPDCSYVKGSLNLSPTTTGIQFSSTGPVVKAGMAALKAAQPNTRILLAVGGASYTNFAATNPQCVKDIIDDFGFDGFDLDYEPLNPSCTTSAGGVLSCTTDAQSIAVATALRNAMPANQYLMSTASWHVGMYGEGAFVNAQPSGSQYKGINLALAKSAVGQSLNLINIMAYDAGNKVSTGFDWAESYRAHRVWWQTQAVAIGIEIPPEAW